jgi:hypothetical protein
VIDVSEMMTDPDFARSFTIKRPRGDFDASRAFRVQGYDEIPAVGIIQPASPETIEQMAEGERSTELVEIWSATAIRKGDGAAVLSDVVIDGDKHYRVMKAEAWQAHGYTYAVAEGFLPPRSA